MYGIKAIALHGISTLSSMESFRRNAWHQGDSLAWNPAPVGHGIIPQECMESDDSRYGIHRRWYGIKTEVEKIHAIA